MSKQPVAASLTSISLDPVPEEAPRQRQVGDTDGPPARAGKVALTLRIDADLHLALKTDAFRRDTSIQDIILEALREAGYKTARPSRR
jgi:hypothetical protein